MVKNGTTDSRAGNRWRDVNDVNGVRVAIGRDSVPDMRRIFDAKCFNLDPRARRSTHRGDTR